MKNEYHKTKQTRQAAFVSLKLVINIPGLLEKEIRLKMKSFKTKYSLSQNKKIQRIFTILKTACRFDTVYKFVSTTQYRFLTIMSPVQFL